MNETLKTLTTRRSVRAYLPDQVKEDDLKQILEAGTYAPTGMGAQSPVMVVVQDPETIRQLSRMNAAVMGGSGDPFYGAPHRDCGAGGQKPGHLCGGRKSGDGKSDERGGIPGSGLLLDSPAREVFDTPEGKELLKKWGLSDNYIGVGNCILGYAKDPLPQPKPRKENYIIRA